ncbi:MAG: hypothetical protein GY853_14350 [PVC group bacterium]|nr:hypothetical protein [PVC group bacterium]
MKILELKKDYIESDITVIYDGSFDESILIKALSISYPEDTVRNYHVTPPDEFRGVRNLGVIHVYLK